MTYSDIQKKISILYPVNNVTKGYKYYVNLLTEKCYGMFNYTGLPENLPSSQIEQRLILTGYCAIFNHKDYGIVTSYGGLSGIDIYYRPLFFVYAQPALGSGNKTIHKDCEIIWNNQVDIYERQGLSTMIMRYARLLADIDSSINIMTVNSRATKLNVANTQQVAKTVDEVMKKMQMGEYSTINQQSIIDNLQTKDFSENRQGIITELLTCRDSMMNSFLSEIGVKSAYTKKERMITDEITSDNQLLLINVKDMLKYRKKGVANINDMFGTNINVEIANEYNPVEVQKNDIA